MFLYFLLYVQYNIMVYVVEISFSTKANKSIQSLVDELDELCCLYNCIEKYHLTETEDVKYNYNTVYVYCCKFELESNMETETQTTHASNISSFTKFLKQLKKYKRYSVDAICMEDVKTDIIYLSPHYLRSHMDNTERKKYIESQRARSYSETDYMILKPFVGELNKYNKEFVDEHSNQLKISYDDYLKMTEK